jgi:hypothetical protein
MAMYRFRDASEIERDGLVVHFLQYSISNLDFTIPIISSGKLLMHAVVRRSVGSHLGDGNCQRNGWREET